MTAPEFEPLSDALSHEAPTDRERQLLLKDARCNLDYIAPWRQGASVRALRAGHEAGRRSVLPAPVRVWREGDPPPGRKVMLVNARNVVLEWDPEIMGARGWVRYLANNGPLFELPVPVDFDAAYGADATRRRALRGGTS